MTECRVCRQPLEEWEVSDCERCGLQHAEPKDKSRGDDFFCMEPNMTTERKKPGRPAPLGRKLTACVRLTPDVDEYLRSTGGLSQVDAIVRETAKFKQWMAAKENGK